jgi:hypothetical protein
MLNSHGNDSAIGACGSAGFSEGRIGSECLVGAALPPRSGTVLFFLFALILSRRAVSGVFL